ncbi:MAG: DUF948 domain-containing protein [Candidatus Geothermincolia bacterium]
MGGVAALVTAISFGLFMLAMAVVMWKFARTVNTANRMLDDVRRSAIPLMSRVQTTMDHVNTGLERVDGITSVTLSLVQSIYGVGESMHRWVTSPMARVLAVGSGIARFLGRHGGTEREDNEEAQTVREEG